MAIARKASKAKRRVTRTKRATKATKKAKKAKRNLKYGASKRAKKWVKRKGVSGNRLTTTLAGTHGPGDGEED